MVNLSKVFAKQQSSDFLPCFGDQKLSAHLQTSLLANCRGGMCGRPGAAQVLTAVLNVASYFLQAQVCLALHSTQALVGMWSVFVGRCMRNRLSRRKAPESLHCACKFSCRKLPLKIQGVCVVGYRTFIAWAAAKIFPLSPQRKIHQVYSLYLKINKFIPRNIGGSLALRWLGVHSSVVRRFWRALWGSRKER